MNDNSYNSNYSTQSSHRQSPRRRWKTREIVKDETDIINQWNNTVEAYSDVKGHDYITKLKVSRFPHFVISSNMCFW